MDKRVEAFLHHELTDEEVSALEQDLRSNPQLAEELAFFLSVKKVAKDKLREDKLRVRHDEWRSKKRQRKPLLYNTWIITAAAALIISIGLGWLLQLNTTPDLSQLSAQYIERNFSTLGVHMSDESDSLQIAARNFNEGDVASALTTSEQILSREPENTEAMRIGGIAALRLKEYDKAIELFQHLGDDTMLYGNPGRFYEAVARLAKGGDENEKLARELLKEVEEKGLEGKNELKKWKVFEK